MNKKRVIDTDLVKSLDGYFERFKKRPIKNETNPKKSSTKR